MKGLSHDSVVKTKSTFKKNRSFSGVELKKSPKSRRKSLAAVLPSSLKSQQPKRENIPNEWIVNEENVEVTSLLSTPKSVKKKKKSAISNVIEKKTKVLKGDDTRKLEVHVNHSSEKKTKVVKADYTTKPEIHANNSSEKKTKVVKADDVHVNNSIENLEQKFNIKSENVKEAVKGIIEFHAQNPKLQKQLFQEQVPLFLQICCHKIPTGPSKILRIPVPNSVLTPDAEVCLIVSEVNGIKNIDHEKHHEHYEELLRKNGVENIKKVMTFHEFRTEYETFEQKSRLVDLYDMFLAEGKICGKVVAKCGKIFYKKRKVPTPVKLRVTKLKKHINKTLSKVFCHLHFKGDSFTVQFGHNKMDIEDLVENIFSIVGCLNKEFPGGFGNIKGLHVFIERAPSIPMYMSFKDPNEIKTPKLKSKKPKAYKSYKGELTTLLDAEVTVRPSGRVFVTRKRSKDKDVVSGVDMKVNKSIQEVNGIESKKINKNKRKHAEVIEEVTKKQHKTKEVNLKVKMGKNRHVASVPKKAEVSETKLKKRKKSTSEENSEGSREQENGKNVEILSTPRKIKKNDITSEYIKKKSKKGKP